MTSHRQAAVLPYLRLAACSAVVLGELANFSSIRRPIKRRSTTKLVESGVFVAWETRAEFGIIFALLVEQ